MLMVVSQKGDACVNIEIAHALSILHMYNEGEAIHKYCIMAHVGYGGEKMWDLGDYDTEDRAKEVIDQIMDKIEEPVYVDAISRITVLENVLPRTFEVAQKRPEWKCKVFYMPQC